MWADFRYGWPPDHRLLPVRSVSQRKLHAFLYLVFFLLSQRVLLALLHQASAPLPKRVFELVSQLKFPGSVLTLVFPGSVLGLPWSSLRVLESCRGRILSLR